MNIEKMSIDHYSAVKELWTATEGMGLRSIDDSKEGIAKFLRRNPQSNFICLEGDKLLGAILSGHDGRRGYIYHAAVKKEYRKLGIGKRLVNQALKSLKAEGINKVALVVFDDNSSGNAFWESLGFMKRTDLAYRNRSINMDNE